MEFAGSNYPVEEEEGGEKPEQAPASSHGSGFLRLLAQNSIPSFPLVVFFQDLRVACRCPAPTEVSAGAALLPLPPGFPHFVHSIIPTAPLLDPPPGSARAAWGGEGKPCTGAAVLPMHLQGPAECSAHSLP